MLINEKIVRQIVRKHLLEEVSKKIQKIKLLNEEVKFKQDPAYEKGKSKFLLVPGPRDKKKEFIKLSKTIRDHLGGKMGVTGNPNYKTAISNLSTDAKVDKIISDIAAGKDAGMKAGLFKKYGEYIKGQSGEIPTNLKRYVEEYVDQIETKIEDGEKNKDNIIKVSEQAAITVMDKEAEKRSSQPRTKKKKEEEDYLSGDSKEKTDSKGSPDPAKKTSIPKKDGIYYYHVPGIEFPMKGGMGFKVTIKNGKFLKMEKNRPELKKKGFAQLDAKEYNEKLLANGLKSGKIVPGKLSGDKIIPITKSTSSSTKTSDEKVYRLKGELSQSEPDKFWGYYTLIDGNWNYIQKKKGGWKPADGRDEGQWKPVKGQKAIDKLNGGTLIDVSTNKPETQTIKGKADPAAKKKRASGKTNTTRPKSKALKDSIKYFQSKKDPRKGYKITYSDTKKTGSARYPVLAAAYNFETKKYEPESKEGQKSLLKSAMAEIKKNKKDYKVFKDDPQAEYIVSNEILPVRRKGEKWPTYYSRKDVQQALLTEFKKKYKLTKANINSIVASAYGTPNLPHGDLNLNLDDKGKTTGQPALFTGVIQYNPISINNEYPGPLFLRFDGSVGAYTQPSKKWTEAIKKAGGDSKKFENDYKAAGGDR